MSLLTVGFSSAATTAAADAKIGYVDLQKAIQSTKAGKVARTSLEKEYESKKKKLQEREKEITKLRDDLEKNAMLLKDDARIEKQKNLQQKMLDYQKLVQQSQQDMSEQEKNLTQPILEKLRKVMDGMAKEGDYTLILEKSEQSVLWAKKDIDLTDELIKKFEKEK
ncbi:MAG: hypothetical protein COT74_08695 [Bdellovibrionales bacterium CG10_big_fil_rev_8_21_14_0_10_45_34]|nr:MAG: hypothetical protein COT74_08695 [Bdellovibrionales bacterium CG10_big_fil_rev_8_21_14_0_10_45_34]